MLENALKFTPAGGHVTLSLMQGHGPTDPVQVIVADTGAGIAEAELPHLFDRLYRARKQAIGEPPGASQASGR